MANKFQKSVKERLEQEVRTQKKEIKATDKSNPLNRERSETGNQQEDMQGKEIPVKESVNDVGTYLRRDDERFAKNKTFYLDVKVIEALHRAAVSQHVTDSKLCNDIMRTVLGLD